MGVVMWAFSIWKRDVRQTASKENKERNIVRELTKEQATELISMIHENMTFAEISSILPLSTKAKPHRLEHGGIWYVIPVGKLNVHLRFAYPGKSYSTNRAGPDSILNLAPALQ